MIWATILQFLSTNVLRILLWTAVSAALAFGAHRIMISFDQANQIKQLETEKVEIQAKDQATINKLTLQYAKNTQVITKQIEQKTWALAHAKKQLEAIKNVRPEDDGVTRNVIINTLNQLREQQTSGD